MESFFGILPTSRKMLHPTKTLQIAVKPWVWRLREQAKLDMKSGQQLDRKLYRTIDDFLNVLGVLFDVFLVILAPNTHSRFGHDFGMLFRRIRGRDVAAAVRRRIAGAPAAHARVQPPLLPRHRQAAPPPPPPRGRAAAAAASQQQQQPASSSQPASSQ